MKLLFEIGFEELPVSEIETAVKFISDNIKENLDDLRINSEGINVFSTPRRLVLSISKLSKKQYDLITEICGPKENEAFDSEGKLTEIGIGFLNKYKIDPQLSYIKEKNGNSVLAIKIHSKVLLTNKIISDLLIKIVFQIPFTKTMHWESSKMRFPRPIRWIMCLLNNDILPLQIAGVASSNKTCGHRFMSPNFQEINQETYFEFLHKNNVVIDKFKRKEIILDKAKKLAKSIGGILVIDESLLEIVSNMVEYPWPILGQFDSKYLAIPQEILICEMREHQKYFAITDINGNLMPNFISVLGSKPNNEEKIAIGNSKVLKARFEDGLFYYEEDLKKKLDEFVDEPPEQLMEWASLLNNNPNLRRAAYLSKADLNSGIVSQFPELQGVMGGIYALHSEEKQEISQAIREQYYPRYAGDKIPSTLLGVYLSLSNRLVILHNNKLPKGNADPFGVRRATVGFVKMILERKLDIQLNGLIADKQILDFIMGRAYNIFSEEYPISIIEATRSVSDFNLCKWLARIQALHDFDYSKISAIFKRVNNIISSKTYLKCIKLNLKEEIEFKINNAIDEIYLDSDYKSILYKLSSIKDMLDKFFAEILVMDIEQSVQNSRLTLLSKIYEKIIYIADFSKLK